MIENKFDVGLIGLGIMGAGIAKNIVRNNISLSVYNRSASKTKTIVNEVEGVNGCFSMYEFVNSLKRPRKILMMISSSAVDDVVSNLIDFLDDGDVIADCSNSNFRDTERRIKLLNKSNIHFLGVGISGGHQGATYRTGIMAGGNLSEWEIVSDIFYKISALYGHGKDQNLLVGQGASGHYAKMIHNGIEYCEFQFLAEIYHVFLHFGFSYEQIALIFEKWDSGDLSSFSLKSAITVCSKMYSEGNHVLNEIDDVAGQNGTGKWAAMDSLSLDVPSNILLSAVFGRNVSVFKKYRETAFKKFNKINKCHSDSDLNKIESLAYDSLHFARIMAYTQEILHIAAGSKKYKMFINLSNLINTWKFGTIIEGSILDDILRSLDKDNSELIMFDEPFVNIIKNKQASTREFLKVGTFCEIPMPCIGASIAFYDSLKSFSLPVNLLQGMRNFFGGHVCFKKETNEKLNINWEI